MVHEPAARPTLEVVAERAGVSRATASRVLRGSGNVSDEAREAVLRAASDVSYTVNRAARALATRRSDTVAFVVTETDDRVFGDPYFARMLRGAQTAVAEAGRQLVLVIAGSAADVAGLERYAGGGHVDGVLLVSMHGDETLPHRLEGLGVPTVLSGRPVTEATDVYVVDADNVAGARTAAQVLLERGVHRPATITGPMDMSAARDRLAGFCDALAGAGVALDDRLVAHGDFTAEGGAAAMRDLLGRGREFDGLFAASDLTAIGALGVLSEHGRAVPDDVAVVGFDDVAASGHTSPPLTTVRQPIEELGATMAQVLLARLAGQDPPRSTVLPVELVRRMSA